MMSMLAYVPQHIAELWAVAFGVFFSGIGVVVILRADSASIYRNGLRLFSADEQSPGPLSRPVSTRALRGIGGVTVAIGLFMAFLFSRTQTGCPNCLEDPWGSPVWVVGSLALWTVAAVTAGIRIRHSFYPDKPNASRADDHRSDSV